MTGWEVLSDAIKIGVPSLLTGLTAFFIANSTRGHEFEKERRRRRQELIERSLEDFETVHAKLERLANLYQAFCAADEPHENDTDFWRKIREAVKISGEEVEKLHAIKGRFEILGLQSCGFAIGTYRDAARTMVFSVKFEQKPPSSNRQSLTEAEKFWRWEHSVVEGAVGAEYRKL